MESNCIVLRNFEAGGFTYYPGMKLNLAEVLREDWVRRGFVRNYKPRKRTAKTNTAVTT